MYCQDVSNKARGENGIKYSNRLDGKKENKESINQSYQNVKKKCENLTYWIIKIWEVFIYLFIFNPHYVDKQTVWWNEMEE